MKASPTVVDQAVIDPAAAGTIVLVRHYGRSRTVSAFPYHRRYWGERMGKGTLAAALGREEIHSFPRNAGR
jgi:hypothetical protein